MTRKFISVGESFAQWKTEPEYAAAYASPKGEFALASSLIKVQGLADMTQEQVARANGDDASSGGAGKVLPSTRTLERFAKATRSRLRISFEFQRKAMP